NNVALWVVVQPHIRQAALFSGPGVEAGPQRPVFPVVLLPASAFALVRQRLHGQATVLMEGLEHMVTLWQVVTNFPGIAIVPVEDGLAGDSSLVIIVAFQFHLAVIMVIGEGATAVAGVKQV